MNLVKLAQDLYQFIEEVQTEAHAQGEHLAALDPFERQLKQAPSVLDFHTPHYLASSNYRIDVFETEKGEIAWAAYSPEAAASDPRIKNSHDALSKYLQESRILETKKRWCGFYTRITGNGHDDTLVLYGMSSDYPHNQYSEEIVKRFIEEKIFHIAFPPTKVIVMDDEHITSYVREDNDLQF